MRNNFTKDWAFGIQGAIESIVRENFPQYLRIWPLLHAFSYEAYILPNNYMAFILVDKLSDIPVGQSVAKKIPYENFPDLPPKESDIELWQSYLRSKFELKNEDAAFIIPVHDSERCSVFDDYDLFTTDEKLFWDKQIKYVVASYKEKMPAIISTKSDQSTNNISGTRHNINSNGSFFNFSKN